MIPLPQAIPWSCHILRSHDKSHEGSVETARLPIPAPMAELAKQIIRQQWPLRHHADPLRRAQARTLIRTHVILLRQWQEAPAAA